MRFVFLRLSIHLFDYYADALYDMLTGQLLITDVLEKISPEQLVGLYSSFTLCYTPVNSLPPTSTVETEWIFLWRP